MYFDGHVHGRSWGESYKDTLERVLAVAQAAGISALVLMGNTKPGLTTAELCIEYVRLARRINPRIKSYGCITGTKDPEQNKRAVEAVRKNEEIVAIKDYLAPSTNPETSVTDPEDQLMQLEVRQKMGFKGVSMEHPECVNIMFDHLYDKDHPESWNRVCRPIESEIAAYTRRKQAAEQVGYEGILNFTHTTSSFVINDILTYEGPLIRSRRNNSHVIAVFIKPCGRCQSLDSRAQRIVSVPSKRSASFLLQSGQRISRVAVIVKKSVLSQYR